MAILHNGNDFNGAAFKAQRWNMTDEVGNSGIRPINYYPPLMGLKWPSL